MARAAIAKDLGLDVYGQGAQLALEVLSLPMWQADETATPTHEHEFRYHMNSGVMQCTCGAQKPA
jgi:hypothetical protein